MGAALYPVEAALEYVGTTHDAAKSCNREGKAACAGNMSEIHLLTGYAMQLLLLLEGLSLKMELLYVCMFGCCVRFMFCVFKFQFALEGNSLINHGVTAGQAQAKSELT
jgi:hypothetical protein